MGSPVIVSFRGERKRQMVSAVDAYMYLLSCFLVKIEIFSTSTKSGEISANISHTQRMNYFRTPTFVTNLDIVTA